jgi:hypothetical protein
MNEMIDSGYSKASVAVVHQLWKERRLLSDAMFRIRDWDLMHAEAFSVERAQEIAAETLETVGE